jgi:hypothetical protein
VGPRRLDDYHEALENDVQPGRQGVGMIVHRILVSLAETVTGITPLVPYYHTVSDERLAHICHLHPYKNKRQFLSDLDFLCRRYQPVSLGDLLDFVKRGKKLKKGSFIITFDDGYSQVYSVVAPLLFQKGIPAIYFLASDFIDNKNLGFRNKASLIVDRLLRDREDPPAHLPAGLAGLNVPADQWPARILAVKYREASVLDEIALSVGIDFQEYLSTEQPYLTSAQVRN